MGLLKYVLFTLLILGVLAWFGVIDPFQLIGGAIADFLRLLWNGVVNLVESVFSGIFGGIVGILFAGGSA